MCVCVCVCVCLCVCGLYGVTISILKYEDSTSYKMVRLERMSDYRGFTVLNIMNIFHVIHESLPPLNSC